MKVTKTKFGMLCDGTKVNLYTVKNGNMSFSCTDYGCTITSIVLNDGENKKTDVLLGYSTLEGYINGNVYFGEYTFFHFSGMVPFNPEKWDYIFGSWIDLPDKDK